MKNESATHCVKATRDCLEGSPKQHLIAFSGTRKECIEFIKGDYTFCYNCGNFEWAHVFLRVSTTKSLSKRLLKTFDDNYARRTQGFRVQPNYLT